MARTNNKPLPHHDVAKQARRLKLITVQAKIKWVGKLSWSDREILLNSLK